jgi:hypothetical protein
MTEQLLGDPRMDAGAQQQGGGAVAQVCGRDFRLLTMGLGPWRHTR